MATTDVGALLRSSREALGLSIASIAQRTRVQPRIIAAIEQNDLSSIPPKPYGRGFIRAYAREVGLDPEQTVVDYFGQFAPAVPEARSTHQPQPWPVQGSWLATAGTLVAALVLLALFQGNTTDAVDTPAPVAVGTSGTANASPRADANGRESSSRDANERESLSRDANARELPRIPDANARGSLSRDANARESARIADANNAAVLTLVLEADRECWVTARADGERVLYELMKSGSKHTIRAGREVLLRAGDAGALRLTVNGRSTGVFGADGQVRTARITPPRP